jgi:hypothetical protein
MRKFFTLIVIFQFIIGNAQTVTKTYSPSQEVFSNPERGFYKFTSAKSSSYTALNQSTLENYRKNDNITLIYREFRLESFLNTPISTIYLSNMQSDFDKIRNAGLKCIIRFTYSNSESATQRDATKTQILEHLKQLKPILEKNVDVISLMQAGFIGTYGEWYYTSQAEFGGYGYDGSKLTQTNYDHRRDVVNGMLDALPKNRMIQLRKPVFKQKLVSSIALTEKESYNQTNNSRVGHFNDCFLASSSDYGTYDNITNEYPYLEQDSNFVPVGGETCKVNSPRSDCSSAVSELKKFHWSFLNFDYHLGVLDGFVQNDCMTDIKKDLGYRFQLNSATLPEAVVAGTTIKFDLNLTNVGYAAPFNERKAYIVLKNIDTNQIFPILMNADPRYWTGGQEVKISEELELPENLTAGNYKMYFSLPDASQSIANNPNYAIRLANDSIWESSTGFNSLNHTLNVTETSLGIALNAKLDLNIYPVPANNEITVELEKINDYKVTLYNSIGQVVNASTSSELNKLTFNTSNLSQGLYFVEFTKDSIRDTRKIAIKH